MRSTRSGAVRCPPSAARSSRRLRRTSRSRGRSPPRRVRLSPGPPDRKRRHRRSAPVGPHGGARAAVERGIGRWHDSSLLSRDHSLDGAGRRACTPVLPAGNPRSITRAAKLARRPVGGQAASTRLRLPSSRRCAPSSPCLRTPVPEPSCHRGRCTPRRLRLFRRRCASR